MLEGLFLFCILVLPYVAGAGVFIALFYWASHSNPNIAYFAITPLVCSCFATAAVTIWGLHETATSHSSTAAIGYIFVPIIAVIVATVSFLTVWSLLYTLRFIAERCGALSVHRTSLPVLVLALFILCLTGAATFYQVHRINLRQQARAEKPDPAVFEKVFAQSLSSYDLEILALLAKNPAATPEQLKRIYDACKSEVNISNAAEYSVYMSLAQNKNTAPEILAVLAKNPESTVRIVTAMNTLTPPETLRELSSDPEDLVRTWAASNPNLPKKP